MEADAGAKDSSVHPQDDAQPQGGQGTGRSAPPAAALAERGFTEKWFADFIRKYHGDIPEETVSFDSAPVHVRAKVANAKRRLAKLGHVPIIDFNARRSPEEMCLSA